MARILRGGIYWAELDPVRGQEQAGTRPVAVLSNNTFNEKSRTVIAVAITSVEPRVQFPLAFELLGTGLPKRSWVKVSQIRVLAVERLKSRAGTISREDLEQLIEGLIEIISE